MFLLTVIGAKEDVTAGVVIIFGKAVTGPILCTADSTALKHVDQFHLHKLLKVVVDGVNRRQQAMCATSTATSSPQTLNS